MRRFHYVAAISVAMLFFVGASRAAASTILVTTKTGITNDGLFNWSSLGPSSTDVTGFSTNVPGIGGLTMTDSGANLERRDQGGGWLGNFAFGEPLVFTTTPGLMDFAFNNTIGGFGVQIEANNIPGVFMARIEAFDASNVSLGFFTVPGNSTNAGDDSAIFIGILSSAADIRRVTVDVPAFQNFAINSPRIQAGGGDGVSAVPEPTSMVLLGTGIVTLVGRRFRRRRSKSDISQ